MSLSFFEAFFFWFYCWERWLLWEARISSNTGGVIIVLQTFVLMISKEHSKYGDREEQSLITSFSHLDMKISNLACRWCVPVKD